MSISLSVVDKADGSGALFTVAGSNPTSTNYILLSSFDGEMGPSGSWNEYGNLEGDGEVDITVDVGYWFGVATNDTDGVMDISPVTFFSVTEGNESILWQCLKASQSRIQLLNLPGVASSSVVVKKLPVNRLINQKTNTLPLPCILLTPLKQTMNSREGVTSKDDVVYPILCSVVSSDNQEPTLEKDLDRQTLWIEKISKAFRNQRLPGVDSVIITHVDPQDVVSPNLWGQNIMASGVIFKFISREPRGLVA